MIFTERTITIIDHRSEIDSPVVLYRGDKNVELHLTIKESKFKYREEDDINVIESAQASYGQLIIKTPNEKDPIFSEITPTKKGAITFLITGEMIDEVTEVGLYDFQVRLLDKNKQSRATIPPIINGIEIREPITAEDSNVLNSATVGMASAGSEQALETFGIDGNYNVINWKFGDRITDAKLNKMDDGIYESYKLGMLNSSQIKAKVNRGEGGVITTAMLSQEVKESMTGGSVPVVGRDAILTENIVDEQVTFRKRTRSSDNIVFINNGALNFDTATKKLINTGDEWYFGLNYGIGHKESAFYYFKEIQLHDIGYIYFNPKLSGSDAFITPPGNALPDDIENCILIGVYDFEQGYFHLNGTEFTVDGVPYYDYKYPKDITGDIGLVYSVIPPNFDTTNKKLITNGTCGVGSRKGHYDHGGQELSFGGFITDVRGVYIGFNIETNKFIIIDFETYDRFTPPKNVLIVGYISSNQYYLFGNYTIDGKYPYENYSYSKEECRELIKNIPISANTTGILYENTLKEDVSDFINNGNAALSNAGCVVSNGNYIVLDKEYSIEQRKTSINFKLGTNGILSFFYKVYEGYELGGSLFSVDAQNNKIILHEQFTTLGTVPAERVSMTYNFVIGREYNLTLLKEKRKNIMRVTDMITGESQQIETECTAVLNDLLNEFAGGRQNGKFGIWNRQGTSNLVSNLCITTNIKNPLLYIIGDSICEGDRCEIGYRYADLVENSLGKGNVAISGMSGTMITGVMNRLKNELPYIRPKYCMVTIGTNGGNTDALIRQLIDYIESLNITPIINHVSQTDGTLSRDINTMVDRFSKYVGCKFDIATALNNDITQGRNTSLYGDGVHPNKNGHAKMFDRFKIDVPYLIY